MPELNLDDLKAETCLPWVGTAFGFGPEGGPVLDLRLAEVVPFGTAQTTGFSLVFQGPAEPRLPQGTHRVRHDGLGEGWIFVVPVGPGTYEAVFNRLATPSPAPGRQ
ncbi:MAG: hypothetical protein HGA66_02360 [Holophaga sp.]|nr:hypothetical protein [Holophaga sp.]